MRKSLIVFVILLAASLMFLFCGAAAIHAGRNDLIITSQALAGDPTAAEGLHVRVIPGERAQLFWVTDYDVTNESDLSVDFQFYGSRQHGRIGEFVREFRLDFGSVGFGISGVIDLEQEMEREDMYGFSAQMLRPAADLARRTAAGEMRTEILRLQDYYEYYPVWLDCSWSGMENFGEIAKAHQDFLCDYFRISVPEGEYVEVTVGKDEAGRVVDVNCNAYYPVEEDGVEPVFVQDHTYSDSVVTEDAAYLLICGTADYSQIKGGYGLYRIPVSEVTTYAGHTFSEPQALLEVEKIENVFPLKLQSSECYRLARGATEKELLLFEQKDTRVTVHILDAETCALLQTIDLQTTVLPNVWYHENLVVLGSTDYGKEEGRLQVLHHQNGEYTLWLDTEFYPLNDTGHYYYDPAFAFDGTRFAMATFHEVYMKASHRITVYDKTGLLYAADQFCNSDDLTEPLTISKELEEPLQLTWR